MKSVIIGGFSIAVFFTICILLSNLVHYGTMFFKVKEKKKIKLKSSREYINTNIIITQK